MKPPDDPATALASAFPGLGANLAQRLVAGAEVVEAPAGREIVVQRGANDSLFLLCSGEVLLQVDAGGSTVSLGSLGRSRWFGELGFLGAPGATATVTATQPSVLVRVPRARLLTWLESDPDLAGALLAEILPGMCHRLRETRGLVDRGSEPLAANAARGESFTARVWRAILGAVR